MSDFDPEDAIPHLGFSSHLEDKCLWLPATLLSRLAGNIFWGTEDPIGDPVHASIRAHLSHW